MSDRNSGVLLAACALIDAALADPKAMDMLRNEPVLEPIRAKMLALNVAIEVARIVHKSSEAVS